LAKLSKGKILVYNWQNKKNYQSAVVDMLGLIPKEDLPESTQKFMKNKR